MVDHTLKMICIHQHFIVVVLQLILEKNQVDVARGGYGLTLCGGTPCTVSRVQPGGSAQRAGLRPGDVISRVNGINVIGATTDVVARIMR